MSDPYDNPAAPRRPRWLIPVIAAAVAAALLVAGLGAWLYLRNQPITASGDFAAPSALPATTNQTCFTERGYTDIDTGAQVVITDATGAVVATTTLGPGRQAGDMCVFAFTAEVPSGSDFYGVAMGRRGVVQFSAEQLAAGVHLRIGS